MRVMFLDVRGKRRWVSKAFIAVILRVRGVWRDVCHLADVFHGV